MPCQTYRTIWETADQQLSTDLTKQDAAEQAVSAAEALVAQKQQELSDAQDDLNQKQDDLTQATAAVQISSSDAAAAYKDYIDCVQGNPPPQPSSLNKD